MMAGSVHDTIFAFPQKARRRKKRRSPPVQAKGIHLEVVGYPCQLLEDEELAAFAESDEPLMPWMGNEDLMVDRYDVRHLLHDLGAFNKKRKAAAADPEEAELDYWRYLDLSSEAAEANDNEEEEASKRQKLTGGYQSVPFTYGPSYTEGGDGGSSEALCERSGEDLHEGQGTAAWQPPYPVPDYLSERKPATEKQHAIMMQTAKFVRVHGGQAEIVLRVKQASNANFNFLMPDDVLHPYFRFLVDNPQLEHGLALAQPKVEHEQTKPVAASSGPAGAVSLVAAAYADEEEEDSSDRSVQSRGEEKQGTGVSGVAKASSMDFVESAEGMFRAPQGTVGTRLTAPKVEPQRSGSEASDMERKSARDTQGPEKGVAIRVKREALTPEDVEALQCDQGKSSVDKPPSTRLVKAETDEKAPDKGQGRPGSSAGKAYVVPKSRPVLPVASSPARAAEGPGSTTETVKEPPVQTGRVIDKMVDFLLRTGLEFVASVMERDKVERKYEFLVPGHEYHPWYRQQLRAAMKAAGRDLATEEEQATEGAPSEGLQQLPPHGRRRTKHKDTRGSAKAARAQQRSSPSQPLMLGSSGSGSSSDEEPEKAVGLPPDVVRAAVLAATRGLAARPNTPNGEASTKHGAKGSSANAVHEAVTTSVRQVAKSEGEEGRPVATSVRQVAKSEGEEGRPGSGPQRMGHSTDAVAAMVRAATRGSWGRQQANLSNERGPVSTTSLPGVADGTSVAELAKAAAAAAAEEGDSVVARLSSEEKRKAVWLKRAKMFTAILKQRAEGSSLQGTGLSGSLGLTGGASAQVSGEVLADAETEIGRSKEQVEFAELKISSGKAPEKVVEAALAKPVADCEDRTNQEPPVVAPRSSKDAGQVPEAAGSKGEGGLVDTCQVVERKGEDGGGIGRDASEEQRKEERKRKKHRHRHKHRSREDGRPEEGDREEADRRERKRRHKHGRRGREREEAEGAERGRVEKKGKNDGQDRWVPTMELEEEEVAKEHRRKRREGGSDGERVERHRKRGRHRHGGREADGLDDNAGMRTRQRADEQQQSGNEGKSGYKTHTRQQRSGRAHDDADGGTSASEGSEGNSKDERGHRGSASRQTAPSPAIDVPDDIRLKVRAILGLK